MLNFQPKLYHRVSLLLLLLCNIIGNNLSSLYICHSLLFKYIELSALRFISQFSEWNLSMRSLAFKSFGFPRFVYQKQFINEKQNDNLSIGTSIYVVIFSPTYMVIY